MIMDVQCRKYFIGLLILTALNFTAFAQEKKDESQLGQVLFGDQQTQKEPPEQTPEPPKAESKKKPESENNKTAKPTPVPLKMSEKMKQFLGQSINI